MVKYPGRRGAIYMSITGTGAASAVVGLTTWSFDQATDSIDVTAFLDTNKTYLQGLKDVKGTFEGFWDDSETKLFAGADSADGVKLYLYPSLDRVASYHYGPAWVNTSMNVGVADAVKVTANFMANGAWGRVAI
jgi:hypothetical protein